jgi:hypothetical protein
LKEVRRVDFANEDIPAEAERSKKGQKSIFFLNSEDPFVHLGAEKRCVGSYLVQKKV